MKRPQMFTTVTVDYPPTPLQLFQLGWNRFFDGLPLGENVTDHERRGYKSAASACAEANTPGYAESQGW